MDKASTTKGPDISFVVIGYNEGATLRACLDSVRHAEMGDLLREIIYVDGGSSDDSLAIAEAAGVNRILGGQKRRRAAENRNLGLEAARGRLVQFVDGDMVVAPDWPLAAVALLADREEVAAVCGNLDEANEGLLFQALQMDWAPREGYIRHCGGAAMYRKSVLERMGGFPTDVQYGEEPLLCWRIRNRLNLRIYQLNRTMADHDLGFRGARDYWRRAARSGATYVEIATRCRGTDDPLWVRESIANVVWAAALSAVILAIPVLALLGLGIAAAALALIAFAVLTRKFIQTLRRGSSFPVALVHAVHTYGSKIPIALGEVSWLMTHRAETREETLQ